MADIRAKYHYLLFDVRRSIRYHQRRRRYFDARSRITNATPIILGSTVVASSFINVIGKESLSIALALVAGFVIWDMVSGTVMMARLHWDLARRFIALEKHLVGLKEPKEEHVIEATGMYLDIEADEPPVLRVLNLLCFNEVVLGEGYPVTELYDVPFRKRLIAQLFNVDDSSICKVTNKDQPDPRIPQNKASATASS